ncbi:MAG: hypothetical protein ACO1OG_06045 [Devosia sp.]
MQLKTVIAAALLACLACGVAAGQSLQPMRKTGGTPSDTKAFRLLVGNPYQDRMTFIAMVMDPSFSHGVDGAVVSPAEFRLAPGAQRNVIVKFKIDPNLKERTIAVCILPKDLAGPVLPRVCGTYTGRMPGAGR